MQSSVFIPLIPFTTLNFRTMIAFYLLISVLSFGHLSNAVFTAEGFPPIDLGYAIHEPTYINVTHTGLKIAGYKNIRFAEPPTGPLRFRKPQTPPPQQTGIQDGSQYISTDCVSSVPAGISQLPGIEGNHWGQEDCLFLNVHVPEGVKPGDHLPVVHWIHGSGYAFGSKDNSVTSVDPVGLLSNIRDGEKVIFVASNYR